MIIEIFIGSISIIFSYFVYKYITCFDKQTSIDLQEIPHFLTNEECDELIQYFNNNKHKQIQSSVDNGYIRDKGSVYLKDRNSIQMWIPSKELTLIKKIQRKAQSLIPLMDYLQESIQLVKYSVGGFFKPHYDEKITFFQSRYYRYSTLLIYLNDDYNGGETVFPYLNITIQPEKGKAIYFKNMDVKTKNILWKSYHGGNTVLSNNKYIANLWVRIRYPNSKEILEKMM